MDRSRRQFQYSSSDVQYLIESSSPVLQSPPHGAPPEEQSNQRKRRRVSPNQSGTAPPSIDLDADTIEAIDLTEAPSALSQALAKQREDAVRAQQDAAHEKGHSILTAYKCPVCLDTPVDATTTVCGHLLCHKCIIDSLKSSEEQRVDAPGRTPKGMCPVCRKPLTRSDVPGPKRNLIPLQLKLSTRKRNATDVRV